MAKTPREKCPFTTPHGILPKYPYGKRKELLHEIRFVNSESLNPRSQRRFKGNETKNSGSSEPSKFGGNWLKERREKYTKQIAQDDLGISRRKGEASPSLRENYIMYK
jgi:hypothetical protein